MRVAAAILLGLAAATCTHDLDAPHAAARLELAPRFAPNAAPSGNALPIDQIRTQVVRHSTQAVVLDKTYPFATGDSLRLDLSIPLHQETDTFDVSLDYERGAEVLFSGSQSVVAGAGASGAPVAILVSYVGPGKNATSLIIAPRDTLLTSGDPLQLRVTVMDTATPDSLYVGWSTNNPGQIVDPTGHLRATISRGTVTVHVVSPSPPGLQDSTTVRIVPRPAAMIKVSGDGQTGVASQALALPLVVQVNGSDNLGVPGVTVTFAVVSGGGALDSTQLVTDSLGRAFAFVTLGPGTGAQTFSASAGGLSVTFGATGGAAPPKTWTGAVSTDWNTAGNWSPSGVPTATDSVTIPNVTNQPHLHTGAFTVRGLSIQSGALVSLDTVTLTVLGTLTDAGGFLDPNASSAISLAGSGTLSGNANANALLVPGSYTLTGDVQGTNVQVNGSLTLGGHALVASGSFVTAGTGVVIMTNAADTLYSQGAIVFGGGAEGGKLLAGTVVVQGGFSVTSVGGFVAGTGLTTVFNGTAVQIVSVVDSVSSSTFGAIDFNNPTAVVLFSLINVAGDVTLESKAIVTSSDTTFTGQGLVVNGNLTTIGGSFLKLGRVYAHGALNLASATWATTAVIFTGTGQTVPTGVTFPFLYSTGTNVSLPAGAVVGTQLAVQGGTLALTGNFSFPGNTFVEFNGKLILNGHTFSGAGAFTTAQGGVLQMTNATDTLVVGGNALFQGGNEAGLLTAGGIVFQGNFGEGSGDPQAFAPSGTHTDAFQNGGSAQTITFGHPGGAGASHFQGLIIANPQGALQIASDVYLMGPYAYLAGNPKIVHGGGQVVHYANLNVTGVTFDNVAIAYDAGLGGSNAIALDSVTFENYNVNSATPLIDITSPGNTASPGTFFLFDNMTFDTDITGAGGTGTYLRVTDSNTGDGNVLTIDINSGLVVTEGMAHTILVGGAVVNWAQP